MKPRKIPARAERVYTYNLARLPKEERKPFTASKTVVNRYETTRPSNEPDPKPWQTKKNGHPDKAGQKATSREASQQKDSNFDLIAWGNTDEETQDFYDKMQEHEAGDPDHTDNNTAAKTPKTHDGEISSTFLNTPVEKHMAAGKDVTTNDTQKKESNIPDFLEGDQPSARQEPLA